MNMKKTRTACGIFIIFLTIFYGCDKNNDSPTDTGSSLQTAFVFIQHYYTGRRAPTWERITIPSVEADGNITGNPLPKINFVQFSTIKVSDPTNFYYFQGYEHFSLENRIWSDSIPEPKFNPLTVKINTNIGEIEGSISVPDTIKTFAIGAGDTMALGTPVTFSWSGSNADYYQVYFFHNWTFGIVGDTLQGWGYLGYSVDTMIRGNSVTFSGSRFLSDGDISEFEVIPINGPLPEQGAKPNLNGKGYGYMYLENKSITSNRTIVIGKGIDYSFFKKSNANRITSKQSSRNIEEKIRTRLGL
jgi:hypothetical protein